MLDLLFDVVPLLNKVVPLVLVAGSGIYIIGSTVMYFLSGGQLGEDRRILFKRHIKILAGVFTIISSIFAIQEITERYFFADQTPMQPPAVPSSTVTPSDTLRIASTPVASVDISDFDFTTPFFQITPEDYFLGTALEVSANGSFIAHATTYLDETFIDVYAAQTGTHVTRLYGHDAVVRSMAFSGDGQLLVSGDEAGQVIVWSIGRKSEVRRFVDEPALGTSNAIQLHTQVAVSDDGVLVAFGGLTETLTIRHISGARVLGKIALHSGTVSPMDFGPVGLNSYRMVTLGNRQRLDDDYGWANNALARVRAPISDITFSSDGTRLAVISRGTQNDIHILQTEGAEVLDQISCRQFDASGEDRPGSFEPTAITFAPFSHNLFIGGTVLVPRGADRGSSVRMWQKEGDECNQVFFTDPELGPLTHLGMTFEGSVLALGTRSGFLFVDTGMGLVRQRASDENIIGYECGTTQKAVRLVSSAPIIMLADCSFSRPLVFRH